MLPWARVGLAGMLAGLAWLTPAVPADAQGSGYLVTIAARTCAGYTDISANKERNNIQESLRDLGPDTKYVSGELVNPAQEHDMQPACEPLSNFSFTPPSPRQRSTSRPPASPAERHRLWELRARFLSEETWTAFISMPE